MSGQTFVSEMLYFPPMRAVPSAFDGGYNYVNLGGPGMYVVVANSATIKHSTIAAGNAALEGTWFFDARL